MFPIFERILRDKQVNTDVRIRTADLHKRDLVSLEFTLSTTRRENEELIPGMKVLRAVRLRRYDPKKPEDKYF